MTTPALQRLREALPSAHITLLTSEKLADVWEEHPALDDLVTFAAAESIFSIGSRLRRGHFSTALILPNSPRSALEAWLGRIPQRMGYSRPWRNWFLTQPIPARPGAVRMRRRSAAEIKALIESPEGTRNWVGSGLPPVAHQIHEYLHLATALGASPIPLAPYLNLGPVEVDKVLTRFDLSSDRPEDPPRPIFGLSPGAEYGPAKRWPRDRFVAAAVELQKRTNCRWILFGGPAEESLASVIAKGIINGLGAASASPLNLAGKTTLREFCALLKHCRLLLTNDSGPMHVAAAVGTPVVALFGSTSPYLTGPGLPGISHHRVLQAGVPCSPCFRRDCPIDLRCLNGITVDNVIDSIVETLRS